MAFISYLTRLIIASIHYTFSLAFLIYLLLHIRSVRYVIFVTTHMFPFDLTMNISNRSNYAMLKAILQVLIYKALYDKSYLGSKTTMTSGECTCLISFATAPLTCSERGGSEKFKMKIYVSSGIRTYTPPVHDRKVAAP